MAAMICCLFEEARRQTSSLNESHADYCILAFCPLDFILDLYVKRFSLLIPGIYY